MTDLVSEMRCAYDLKGDTYSSMEVFGMLSRGANEIELLRTALKDVFVLIDEGWLVRNTSEDHKPSFAMRQLSFVQRLAKAHAVIDEAEPASPKQPGDKS